MTDDVSVSRSTIAKIAAKVSWLNQALAREAKIPAVDHAKFFSLLSELSASLDRAHTAAVASAELSRLIGMTYSDALRVYNAETEHQKDKLRITMARKLDALQKAEKPTPTDAPTEAIRKGFSAGSKPAPRGLCPLGRSVSSNHANAMDLEVGQ